MRQLGRLLICLKKKTGNKNDTMYHFVHLTKFRMVVEAAQECAGFDEVNHTYSTPSQAIKSGQLMKKIAELKMTQALERGEIEVADSCGQFLKLCDLQWSELSTTAHRNLSERKRNSVRFLPLTEDVVKLSKYLDNNGYKQCSVLQEHSDDAAAYSTLTQIVLAKLILFNRKRQGEVSRTLVADWKAKSKANPNSSITECLSEVEKGLLKVLERLEIRGKRGRIVPILITEDINNWMKILLQVRSEHIPDSNPFLFPSNTAYSHLRGSDIMRRFASECGASKPNLLISTQLRKHVASMAQVLNLKEHEMDMLASFLGHDIRVHTAFYRLPLDVMQIARVSKWLMATEKGHIGQCAGKGLGEITIDANDEVELEDDCGDSDSDIEDTNSERAFQQENVYSHSERVHTNAERKQKKRKVVFKKWTTFEKDAVSRHFASSIINKKLPSKESIVKFLVSSKIDRSWTNVKDHIRNTYLK